MIIQEYEGEIVVLENTGAIVIDVKGGAQLHTLIFTPPSRIASYDIKIGSSKGVDLLTLKNRVGKTKKKIDVLVTGSFTIEILGASTPGKYGYYLAAIG